MVGGGVIKCIVGTYDKVIHVSSFAFLAATRHVLTGQILPPSPTQQPLGHGQALCEVSS